MSTLLAVVQSVVATPTPVPTPDLTALAQAAANEVAKQSQGTSAVVVQAAQIAGVFLSAFFLSVVHRVTEFVTAREKGWGDKVNVPLATLYSAGVGLVGVVTMHQFGSSLKDLVAIGLTTSVALTGSFWTYAVRKVLSKFTGAGVTSTSAVETPVLAVEEPPVNPAG